MTRRHIIFGRVVLALWLGSGVALLVRHGADSFRDTAFLLSCR